MESPRELILIAEKQMQTALQADTMMNSSMMSMRSDATGKFATGGNNRDLNSAYYTRD